ncbi:hypothetical protein [Streptomyces formicae]
MSSTKTAWPAGVSARYLTVGGATVDITRRFTLPPDPEPYATLATCTGCPDSKETSHYRTYYPSGGFLGEATEEHEPEAAEEGVREWAQAHAEKCRAMPKPEA